MHTENFITTTGKSRLNDCGFLRSTVGVQEVKFHNPLVIKSAPPTPVVKSYDDMVKKLENHIIEEIVNANDNFIVAQST